MSNIWFWQIKSIHINFALDMTWVKHVKLTKYMTINYQVHMKVISWTFIDGLMQAYDNTITDALRYLDI